MNFKILIGFILFVLFCVITVGLSNPVNEKKMHFDNFIESKTKSELNNGSVDVSSSRTVYGQNPLETYQTEQNSSFDLQSLHRKQGSADTEAHDYNKLLNSIPVSYFIGLKQNSRDINGDQRTLDDSNLLHSAYEVGKSSGLTKKLHVMQNKFIHDHGNSVTYSQEQKTFCLKFLSAVKTELESYVEYLKATKIFYRTAHIKVKRRLQKLFDRVTHLDFNYIVALKLDCERTNIDAVLESGRQIEELVALIIDELTEISKKYKVRLAEDLIVYLRAADLSVYDKQTTELEKNNLTN